MFRIHVVGLQGVQNPYRSSPDLKDTFALRPELLKVAGSLGGWTRLVNAFRDEPAWSLEHHRKL